MVSTDPIADMLSRIRNAIAVGKHEVRLPHSKVKETIARLLADNRYIQSVSVDTEHGFKDLVLTLSSTSSNAPITEIARLSTPGRRWYVSASDIPVVKRGRGIVIISTSKGMMTGQQAKQQQLGGELICKVY